MMMTFVPELNKSLTEPQLAIWEGRSGLPKEKEEAYRKRWRGETTPPPEKSKAGAVEECRFRGDRTGDTVGCSGCRGKVDLHVYSCEVYGECVMSGPTKGVAGCRGCIDRQDPLPPKVFPTPSVRHLLYHICPLDGPNGAWRWNVDQLRQRLHLFNGTRVVAVATDPPEGRKPQPEGPFAPVGRETTYPCASFEDVVKEFGEDAAGIEFVKVENDPSLCEVASHLPLFARLADNTGPEDVLFWGHNKGATRPPGSVTERWTEALYETYLDYWPVVEDLLERYPVVGAFKKLGRQWPAEQSTSDWHYSGSFFWARCRELFKKDWERIDEFWSGIEPYPSLHFSAAEAGCIFHEGRMQDVQLYDPAYWDSTVTPALERFRKTYVRSQKACSLPLLPDLKDRYDKLVSTPSDINEHLHTLRSYASRCGRVVEFGVRTAMSTTALLAGVWEGVGTLVSYDTCPSKEAAELEKICKLFEFRIGSSVPIQVVPEKYQKFIGDTPVVEIPRCDMLFIDTIHEAWCLKEELERHAGKVSRYIFMHDTTLYGITGSDGKPGLVSAILSFLLGHPEWEVHRVWSNNNGLTMLKRRSDKD